MATIAPDALKKVLRKHLLWRNAAEGGERANLRAADLRSAHADAKTRWPAFYVCPDVGAFTGWKKLHDGVIAQITIPDDARRTSSLIGRKCRAEFAHVVALTASDGTSVTEGVSSYDKSVRYVVGKTVRPDSFDDDIKLECTNGIHFLITRQEAEAYG